MNTQNIQNCAYAHWLDDGLFEIGLGILLTGVGALRAIIHFADEKSAAYYWLSGGLFLFMAGSVWAGQRLGKVLKERITYPRTGFLAFKSYKFNFKRILVLIIFGGILGGIVGVLASQPNQQEIGGVVPITMGVVAALVLAYSAQRVETKRFYFLAAISIGIGLILGLLRVGVVLGVSYFYLSIGLAMVASGCIALVQFLRSHEPVDLNGEIE